MVYGFTPREDSPGSARYFFIFLRSFSRFLRSSNLPPPLPLSPLRLGMGAHAVCAEFESPCNKIRALCDGRVTPRIYLRKGEMYTGRGTYIPSRVRWSGIKRRWPRELTTEDVNNTTKLLPASFFLLPSSPFPFLPFFFLFRSSYIFAPKNRIHPPLPFLEIRDSRSLEFDSEEKKTGEIDKTRREKLTMTIN